MANLNRVLLMGNLTRDPELRYVPSGTAVTNFSLAVNRIYTSPSGEKKKETCFVRIVAWGRMAETCGEFLMKGSSVFVEGRLQSRSWEGSDGQKRNTIEVVANNIQFLDRLKARQGTQESNTSQETASTPREEDVDQSLNMGKAPSSKPSTEQTRMPPFNAIVLKFGA